MHFRIFETWRLAAALLVMCFHYLLSAPPGHEPASAALYRLMPLLEMFFMISGFLIMLRYGETLGREPGAYRAFLVRRIARFYPLYLATLAFFALIGAVVGLGLVPTDHPGRYDWGALPANLLLMQAWGVTGELTFNYVAWCVSAEWFCYLALPVIVLAFRHAGYLGLTGVALLTITLLEAGIRFGAIPFGSWLEANTWGAYRAFADFALGALVAMAVRDGRWRLRSHLPGWLAFAAAVGAMLTLQNSYVILALLMAAMYLAALAERNNPDGSRWLAFLQPLGRVSLGIYLIHPVMEAVFISVVWRRIVEPTQMVSFYAYWLVPIGVTLLAALLSMRFYETPAASWINARVVGKPASRIRPVADAG